MHHQVERRRDQEGFTLIELMVVVLIMGILMAIAIPTFLSTRGSANDASAKSNATNAYTNEKSYYASNQVFYAATSMANGDNLDPTLPWGAPTTQGNVGAYATPFNGGTTDNVLLVESYSKSGNCFYILDIEQNNSATIAYNGSSVACAGTLSFTAVPTITSGSSGIQTSAPTATTGWYSSW